MKEAETAPEANHQAIHSWVAVALLLAIATALDFLMEQHVSLTSQAMVYVLAVVIASYTLRWQESVVGAVLAVFAFNFFGSSGESVGRS
jgi:two-component system sensor histidine kinase KdpD